MKASIMAHMVACYPDEQTSFRTACALLEGGASYLEVQFPFSDPSADGPAIQAACTKALQAGFKVDLGWDLIKRIRKVKPEVPVFVMSYGSIVFTKGVDSFVRQAKAAGVTGLIIPDLAPGADEGLFEAGRKRGLAIVPVIVPTIGPDRLKLVLDQAPEYLYAAIRTGITGHHTELDEGLLSFLKSIAEKSKVLAGFGIDSPDQVRALAPIVHSLVVGTAFVRQIEAVSTQGGDAVYQAVRGKLEQLLAG